MKYIVNFIPETGQISYVSHGAYDTLPPNSIIVESDKDSAYIVNNYAVYNNNLYYIGLKPSPHYKLEGSPPAWVPDILLAKNIKWDQIKKARDSEEFNTFTWNSYVFNADPVSQQRILIAALSAQNSENFEIEWTLADGSIVHLDKVNMLMVSNTLAEHNTFVHNKARALKEQIYSATTLDIINNISW